MKMIGFALPPLKSIEKFRGEVKGYERKFDNLPIAENSMHGFFGSLKRKK